MHINEIIKDKINPDTQFFILDSHDHSDSVPNIKNNMHNDTDFKHYGYNTRQHNKLNIGDFFIYRKPSNSTDDKKFFFYGIARVKNIRKVDDKSNVIAELELGYKFEEYLYQGSHYLENNMKWTFKSKGENWRYFFTQYGMTQINKEDFLNLLKYTNLYSVADNINELNEMIKDLEEVNYSILPLSFNININTDERDKQNTPKFCNNTKNNITCKVNFIDINKANKKIGDIGEEIILNYEKEYLIQSNRQDLANLVEHTSNEHGDGFGYDIVSYDLDGNKKYIEVKTTKYNLEDNFYMSPREIQVSKEIDHRYYIYRLFNLNVETSSSDLRIYNGAITEYDYHLKPNSYKITFK